MRSHHHPLAPGQLGLGLFDDASAIRDLIVSGLVRDESTRIVHELALRQGTARADLAVITDRIDAYEIKSAHDDMRRLAGQAPYYGEVFDSVTIVTAPRHLAAVHGSVPPWWGIAVAHTSTQTVDIARTSRCNPSPSPEALVRLLRLDETAQLIAERVGGTPIGTRLELWSKLLRLVEADELRAAVCRLLRERQDWSIAY